MKLKYEMEILDVGGDITAVPLDCENEFHGILQINESTAAILKLLEKETDEDSIVAELKKVYEADEETLRLSVRNVVEKLKANGLL